MPAIALIPIDLERSRLGLRSMLARRIAGQTVLAHTLRRIAQAPSVSRIVLVHPPGQDPLSLVRDPGIAKPITTFADAGTLGDRHTSRLRIARLWAPTAWRGGLGGATVFDELLPPDVLVRAMGANDATSALIVGGDWCVVDPSLCEGVLAQHLGAPDGMKITFTQAPPGLCGIATSRVVLEDLAQNGANFGNILGYSPRAPIPDPIGKEANLPIPPEVRDANYRFVCDTSRAAAMLDRVAADLGNAFLTADATAIAAAAHDRACVFADLSQQITLELTPRREVKGPVVPQHYASFDRPDLDIDLASRLVEQLGEPGDTALLLGGLGDALLHPQWREIVHIAKEAGVATVGIETDLLCDGDTIHQLLDSPVDLVTIRLNADTAATYARVMGADAFPIVIRNLELLLNSRNRRASEGGIVGLPWILPRLVKMRDTLLEIESFFDKWMVYAGHAVIEPSRCGCGVMPELSPVPMAPPLRRPCRQVGRRMTILADGAVALCDQDWHGRAPLGDALIEPLTDVWRRAEAVYTSHREHRFAELTLCGSCTEWHRP